MTLQPDPSNRYSADSPIATLQENGHGVNTVKAVTSVKEILEMMQTPPSSPSLSLSKSGVDKDDIQQDKTTPNKSAQLKHPSSVERPFHSLYTQATAFVNKEDERRGRKPDEYSERLALSAMALAVENGITKIDHLVLSKENKERGVKAGENVVIVQGSLDDPAHNRADMKTEVAINIPVEQSLDTLYQRQAQEAHSLAQQPTQNPDQDPNTPRGPKLT